jgi:hypothetical protein
LIEDQWWNLRLHQWCIRNNFEISLQYISCSPVRSHIAIQLWRYFVNMMKILYFTTIIKRENNTTFLVAATSLISVILTMRKECCRRFFILLTLKLWREFFSERERDREKQTDRREKGEFYHTILMQPLRALKVHKRNKIALRNKLTINRARSYGPRSSYFLRQKESITIKGFCLEGSAWKERVAKKTECLSTFRNYILQWLYSWR